MQDQDDLAARRPGLAARMRQPTELFRMVGLVLVLVLLPLAVAVESNTGAGGPLAHFDRDGLAFDYPATWTVSPSGVNLHLITVLDFLGTGTGRETCTVVTPGPGIFGGASCEAQFQIEPGQVVVEISIGTGPGGLAPIDPRATNAVKVGGLPATFEDVGSAAPGSAVLEWELSVPGDSTSRYHIQAVIKGPGEEQLRAQVQALVASIRFDPAAPS
jgi:hypothetical protein